ncbi:CWF19-like protein 2 [Labeo rohita]|uniref:CWF19-like protein 2 n=1 Tax=Labeo rohita TaxID=84645 RepID=A0ABQ8M0P0_LABRO|nr:CWF19-like protein 2 [Labeo rohita]
MISRNHHFSCFFISLQAKEKYEKEERRKAERKARGEDTWMLPDVDLRLQQIGEDSEDEWVEARPSSGGGDKAWKAEHEATPAASSASANQRDEWMTFDFLAMKTTSQGERRAQKEAEKEAERQKAQSIEQAGLHRLELNPYWKDGGSGLPPEETSSTAVKKAGVVNDGGVSWLRKSYQRMKEQADREQRSLESVVAERYGSMEEFQNRLQEAEEAAYGDRREERSEKRGDRERWRRDDRDEGRQRWRRGDREERRRDRSPHAERERERDFERGSRGRDERHPRSRPDPDEDRQSQRRSASSVSSFKFLKPSEADDDFSGGAEFRRAGPKGSTSNQSAGFRKPVDDDAVVPAWRKSSAVQEPKETPNPQKHTEKSAAPLEESKTTTTVSSSESEEEEEEEVILTDEEMNKLGAKLVKAELMGNTALAEKLKDQMEAARRAKENRAQRKVQNKPVSAPTDAEKEVVLFRTDPSGRAWPVKAPSQAQEPKGGRRKRKAIETHQDGERVRYFEDDDGMNLQEMVRREKMSSAEDQNALYSRMAAKVSMMGRTDGDNYTLDDMFVSSAAQKERSGRDEERQRNKAVQETRRLAGQMEKCRHCFDSPELPKHLIVAVYLCLPNCVSLTEGHCLIVPIQHHTAATGLDEDIWSEIQMFRRALVRMFESQELDCVFLETHMNPKRHLHMVYECVPMPRELGDMAPIYFKKAIMESDEEWAMNKKVVDLSSKDIRQAVPRGLPYFSVDFGLQGGFAHVIENEQKFPHYFGKEILGGMLDLEPRRWRKPIRENFDDQRKKVLKFAQWWKEFDCTKTDS